MVVPLLDGLDLVFIALFLVLYGLLYGLKYTIGPMLSALHSALGWIPGVGNLVQAADNAIIGAINAGLQTCSQAVADLWHGLLESLIYMVDGVQWFAGKVDDKLHELYSQTLGDWARWALGEALIVIGVIPAPFASVADWIVGEGLRLEHYAATHASAAQSAAEDYTDGQIQEVYATALHDANNALVSANQYTDAAILTAEGVGAAAVNRLQTIEAEAISALGQAEGATAGELRDLLDGQAVGDIAAIIASVPFLQALVKTLESETGLDNEACRTKVKGICSTPSSSWSRLIGLLSLTAEWPGLDELTEGIADMTADVVDGVEALIGV
jgi:hypothetical protein